MMSMKFGKLLLVFTTEEKSFSFYRVLRMMGIYIYIYALFVVNSVHERCFKYFIYIYHRKFREEYF